MQGSRYWGKPGGTGWMPLFLVILILLGDTGLFVMGRGKQRMQSSRYWGKPGGTGWMPLFLVILILLGDTGLFVMGKLGGRRDIPGFQNSIEIQDLARFAVEQYNKQQNTLLSFSRVVKAQEQVVAGTLYYLTIEAKDHGTPRLYEAKIWVKPWQNFKQLQEFKPVSHRPFTAADLGVKQEGLLGTGWRTVSVHDPVIQEAAELAVKNIEQKSNSLASYELQEILLAKAEVIEDWTKFDLLLKIKRGTKHERYKVEMLRRYDGRWALNDVQQDILY